LAEAEVKGQSCMAMIVALVAVLVALKFLWLSNPAILAYSVSVTLFLGATVALALRYEETPMNSYRPTVSVIIPAYNEELRVLELVVRSALGAEYPEGKKEVIVVDDGSTNGSVKALDGMDGDGVRVISTGRNLGNKFARAEGIRASRGEILVFIDSDTLLRGDSILRIVAPFVDERVGSVSGHLRVNNWGENALTKLQEGWYYTSFRAYRGAESGLGLVTCCPGAFSAHRRSAITEEVLAEWLYGRFMGLEVSAGTDRALTNLVIRSYDSRYQYSAVGDTEVPDKWGKFLRQQVRWTKSWIRETFYLMAFAYRKGTRSLFFYCSAILHLANYVVLAYLLIAAPLLYGRILGAALYMLGLTIPGLVYALLSKGRIHEWRLRVIFPLVYAVTSLPIFAYSLATIWRKGWGTR